MGNKASTERRAISILWGLKNAASGLPGTDRPATQMSCATHKTSNLAAKYTHSANVQ